MIEVSAAQLSATKERYRCGVPLAGAPTMRFEIESNRCLSVCWLPPKSIFSIEEQSTEKPCHCEEGVSPTWQSVPLNVSIIWEFGIRRMVLRIRIATATGGLAMTVRNLIPLIPYS